MMESPSDSKRCTACGVSKVVGDFYSSTAGRRMANCKPCWRAKVASRRKANHAAVCAYDRERSRRPERKAKVAEYQRARRIREPEKYAARTAVDNAVRRGRLVPEPCAHCGANEVQAHHRDYSRPLDVVWCCFRCHREIEHAQDVDVDTEVSGARHFMAIRRAA